MQAHTHEHVNTHNRGQTTDFNCSKFLKPKNGKSVIVSQNCFWDIIPSISATNWAHTGLGISCFSVFVGNFLYIRNVLINRKETVTRFFHAAMNVLEMAAIFKLWFTYAALQMSLFAGCSAVFTDRPARGNQLTDQSLPLIRQKEREKKPTPSSLHLLNCCESFKQIHFKAV